MLVWKRIAWLRERIKEQRNWIDECGGSLARYIANYGDQGFPPLDQDGNFKTIRVPIKDQHLVEDLERVPGTEDQFYAPFFGSGGTAIYEADSNRLKIWERELSELEISCHGARKKADEKARKNLRK